MEIDKLKRLELLIKYHHSYSIQYASIRGLSSKDIKKLKEIEQEIEEHLLKK